MSDCSVGTTEGAMGTQPSQRENQSSSIIGDTQVSLAPCDESVKRDASEMEDGSPKKANKRRRSSLATHRRSITGAILPTFQTETECGTQSKLDTESQKNVSEGDGQSPPKSSTDGQSLFPNPVNAQMDIIIEEMESQIKTFEEECKQWKELLAGFDEQEEQTKLLAMNLTLPMTNIPTEVKEFGMSEYVWSKPLNLQDMKSKLDNLLLQYQFDKESCMQDLRLMKETVEAVRNTNKCMASCLAKEVEADMNGTQDTTDESHRMDSKQIMLDFIGSA